MRALAYLYKINFLHHQKSKSSNNKNKIFFGAIDFKARQCHLYLPLCEGGEEKILNSLSSPRGKVSVELDAC